MDMFCKKCTLQFDKKYVFDLHLFLVHGEEMAEVKFEPIANEENLQELQMNEQVFSDNVVDTGLKYMICGCLFKTKTQLEKSR